MHELVFKGFEAKNKTNMSSKKMVRKFFLPLLGIEQVLRCRFFIKHIKRFHGNV